MNEKLLVTGMSGLVGSALREAISDQYTLSAFNRRDVPGVPTTCADLADYDALRAACEGQDMVVHLAAVIHDGVGWDALLNTNVIGTRNVFEAAVAAGVKRVVFTSSGATVAGWEKVEPYRSLVNGETVINNPGELPAGLTLIDETMATRPANVYASTKVWGEAMARHYADNHGLEVICLRIGFASEADKPENARQMSVWNSQRDVVQAIRLALEHPMERRFDCFFITSNNARSYRDLSHARQQLGFEPLDSADDPTYS